MLVRLFSMRVEQLAQVGERELGEELANDQELEVDYLDRVQAARDRLDPTRRGLMSIAFVVFLRQFWFDLRKLSVGTDFHINFVIL